MKKLTVLVAALVLTLGLAQCKKEQTPTGNANEGVTITLNVGHSAGSGANGSRVNVNPDALEGQDQITFANGDQILVASDGHYVGYLQHDGTNFSGSITDPVEGQPLYFYFLGNKADVENLTPGTTEECTVNISDQTTTAGLPVISMGKSTVNYATGTTSYSSRLYNKCSLMKFNVTTPSTAAICIAGMNNKVTVDFSDPTDSGFAYGKDGDGVIKMQGVAAGNTETWAIVLPQDVLAEGDEGSVYTDDGIYVGQRPEVHEIESNKFYHEDADVIVLEVNDLSPLATPLTFEAIAGGTITFKNKSSGIVTYRINGGDAQTINIDDVASISVSVGQKVSFYGDNDSYFSSNSNSNYSNFGGTAECYIYGNIMSLVNSTSFATETSLSSPNAFRNLFRDNLNIDVHPDKPLLLPATTLTERCYSYMFIGCSSLTTAPALPAMTLANSCYEYMFNGCTSLTTAPALPATTLADSCYQYMFNGCTSLTTAPELPAETSVLACYNSMFYNCTNLNVVKCSAITGIDSYNTVSWLRYVANSGTFYKASNASWQVGSGGIPNGWTTVDL